MQIEAERKVQEKAEELPELAPGKGSDAPGGAAETAHSKTVEQQAPERSHGSSSPPELAANGSAEGGSNRGEEDGEAAGAAAERQGADASQGLEVVVEPDGGVPSSPAGRSHSGSLRRGLSLRESLRSWPSGELLRRMSSGVASAEHARYGMAVVHSLNMHSKV